MQGRVGRRRLYGPVKQAVVCSVVTDMGQFIGCVIKEASKNGDRSPISEDAKVMVVPRGYSDRITYLLDVAREVRERYAQRGGA